MLYMSSEDWYEYKYLKYKNKYLNLINNLSGVNQAGGDLEISKTEYGKQWWNKNVKYKTGEFTVGLNADGSVRNVDFDKHLFIDYVVYICNNRLINETKFISQFSFITRKEIEPGSNKYALYYNNKDIISKVDGSSLIVKGPAQPHIVGSRVKFTVKSITRNWIRCNQFRWNSRDNTTIY